MTSMVSAAEAMGAEIDGGRQIVRADLATVRSCIFATILTSDFCGSQNSEMPSLSYLFLLLLHLPFDYSTLWFLTNIKYIQYI